MKKIMFLLLSCAVLTTFSALTNAQIHETRFRPEPVLNLPTAIQNQSVILNNPNLGETIIQREPTVISTPSAISQPVIQVTPTPPEEDNSHHIHGPENTSPTPTPPVISTQSAISEQSATGGGERYPQTRTKLITEQETAAMSYAQLRYAINEIYARHGFDFSRQPAIANRFRPFEWYHPKEGVLMTEIENEFSETERANVKVLARYRDQRWASGER